MREDIGKVSVVQYFRKLYTGTAGEFGLDLLCSCECPAQHYSQYDPRLNEKNKDKVVFH